MNPLSSQMFTTSPRGWWPETWIWYDLSWPTYLSDLDFSGLFYHFASLDGLLGHDRWGIIIKESVFVIYTCIYLCGLWGYASSYACQRFYTVTDVSLKEPWSRCFWRCLSNWWLFFMSLSGWSLLRLRWTWFFHVFPQNSVIRPQLQFKLLSGELTYLLKTTTLVGKSSINGPFSRAMLVYQRTIGVETMIQLWEKKQGVSTWCT